MLRATQGGSAQFPLGCSLGPFPFVSAIKCHQKSTYMQLGWVARSVLSTPPGPPHSWDVRPCRASTYLAPLYPPRACLPFGWESKPPSRSALAPVESPSPGPRTRCPFHRLFILETAVFSFRASGLQNEIGSFVVPAGRSADVVEPHYALWGCAMHPGPCDSLHLPKKLCRWSPSPENFVVVCSLFVLMR